MLESVVAKKANKGGRLNLFFAFRREVFKEQLTRMFQICSRVVLCAQAYPGDLNQSADMFHLCTMGNYSRKPYVT